MAVSRGNQSSNAKSGWSATQRNATQRTHGNQDNVPSSCSLLFEAVDRFDVRFRSARDALRLALRCKTVNIGPGKRSLV